MCGIIGYVGDTAAAPILLKALQEPGVSRLRFGGHRHHL